MAEVAPFGNKCKPRRSERTSKITKMNAKESLLITVPPGFELKSKDQKVLHEGTKNQEEQSGEASETEGN
jgi:hypothetical protein